MRFYSSILPVVLLATSACASLIKVQKTHPGPRLSERQAEESFFPVGVPDECSGACEDFRGRIEECSPNVTFDSEVAKCFCVPTTQGFYDNCTDCLVAVARADSGDAAADMTAGLLAELGAELIERQCAGDVDDGPTQGGGGVSSTESESSSTSATASGSPTTGSVSASSESPSATGDSVDGDGDDDADSDDDSTGAATAVSFGRLEMLLAAGAGAALLVL